MADGNIYGLTLLPHDVADDLLIINNDGTLTINGPVRLLFDY